MATANFYPHKNGIYVLEMMTEEESRETLLNNGHEEDEIDYEAIQEEIGFQYEFYVRDFIDTYFPEGLEEAGYNVMSEDEETLTVWSRGKNHDRIVAEISFKDGYYSHVQLIVEIDKDYLLEKYVGYMETVTEERENYTPHNKKLFKLIERYTRRIEVLASASNGETFYQ